MFLLLYSYSSGAPVGGNISVIAVMEAVTKEDNRESKGYEMSLDSVSRFYSASILLQRLFEYSYCYSIVISSTF